MKSTSTERSMPDKNHAARAHRRPRLIVILAWLIAFILILFLAVLGAASWYFSSQLLDVRPDRPSYDLKVLALGRTTIKLPRTGSTQRPGVYGIDWPGGRVTLRSIVSMTSRTVVR